MHTPDIKRVARSSRTKTPMRFLARAGFAVNGLVNAIIGFIALGISATGGGSADQSGAFATIAATPGGMLALWFITIALAALGLWYVLGSLLSYGADTKRRAAKIATQFGKGFAYLLLAAAAFGFVMGAGGSGASQTTALTSQLMATPGGIVIVGLIGLLFVGIGIYMVRKGVKRGFERDIVVPTGKGAKVVLGVGTFGYVARGLALFIVGALFLAACITVDPSKATGLDGALKTLAGLPFGQALLAVVGLGFIAYGIYSAMRARLARLA